MAWRCSPLDNPCSPFGYADPEDQQSLCRRWTPCDDDKTSVDSNFGSCSPSASASASASEPEDLDNFVEEEDEQDFHSLIQCFSSQFENVAEKRMAEKLDFITIFRINAETQTEAVGEEEDLGLAKRRSESVVVKSLCNSARHVETQTDNASASVLLASTTSREDIQYARQEVAKLREAREIILAERKSLTAAKSQGSKESIDESVLYEFEEAIEAIDTAIDFKNETICGQENHVSEVISPAMDKANLITRLASLSVHDLQRLWCKNFSKVVELRISSRKLEKNVEKLEEEKEKLNRRLLTERSLAAERERETQNHIAHFLQNAKESDKAFIKVLMDRLKKAERRQQDYKASLTELLVKHGYLLNGADYDVQEVVRLLGIDIKDMGSKSSRSESKRERASRNHGLTVAGHGQGGPSTDYDRQGGRRAIHQRRNAQIVPPPYPGLLELNGAGISSHRPRHLPHHHYLYNPQSQQQHRESAHGAHSQAHSTHHRHQQECSEKATEVRREKNKLIIQPHPSSSH